MLFTPQLSDTVKGRVIAPDDPDYDSARTVFYGGIDRRPAAVVRPVDATDVARVIATARETGHELAVRSGGHSPAGHGASDGGIVIDLSAMRGLQIDARRRVAWADAGLTAGEYTIAAAEHGLATAIRRRRHGRHRRHHAGGRRRLPGPQARPDDRRRARRRDRHRRRRDPLRRRRLAPRPVLGDPRRRRQLRRRDRLPVPAARGAAGRRRHADPARDGGDRSSASWPRPRRRPTSCRRSPTS